MEKKVVVQLNFEGDEIKKKVMGKVAKIKGVVSIEIGSDKKMTVIGDMDPVSVDKKLKTLCSSKILHFGPAKAEVEEPTTAATTTTYVTPPQPDYQYAYPYPFPYSYPYNTLPTAPPWPFN